ncbi:lipopolysaccharide biosynthesis protein [Chitinibacteraceae bacterium HSL-7]
MIEYSRASAVRGVRSFAIGKVVSAISTFAALFFLVRLLAPSEYGLYVAYFSIVEIFYLVSGVGLSTFAQKYLTEFAAAGDIGLVRRYGSLSIVLRILFSIIFVLFLYFSFDAIAAYFDFEKLAGIAAFLMVLLVLELLLRYLSEIFPALMWQGSSQLLFLVRSLVRCVSYGVILFFYGSASLVLVFSVDLVATLAAVVYGVIRFHSGVMQRSSEPSGMKEITSTFTEMASVCLRFYAAQVAGQTYGNHMLKLIVLKLFGSVQAGVYGFAQALADMLRNYLPGYLLLGVVRPMFVARYEQRKDPAVLDEMFNFVLKMNFFTFFPVALFLAATGDSLLSHLSGGKYEDSSAVLMILLLVLSMQCVHQVLGMINLSTGSPNVSMKAYFLAPVGLVFGLIFARYFGYFGVAWGAVVSELVWCAACIHGLKRVGMVINVAWSGFVRLVICLLIVGGAVVSLESIVSSGWMKIGLALAGVLAYFILCAVAKPFSDRERDWIRSALPTRIKPIFVW